MNTNAVIRTLRNYWSNDADILLYMKVANRAAALKQIIMKDTFYMSKSEAAGYSFPMVLIKFNEDPAHRTVPSNNVLLEVMLVATTGISDSLLNLVNLKDRLRELMHNYDNSSNKHIDINNQAAALGLNIKVRDVSWVRAWTYDDVEQGSERLHRIMCLMNLVVGE
jgi:hypothetical protein